MIQFKTKPQDFTHTPNNALAPVMIVSKCRWVLEVSWKSVRVFREVC